MASQLSTGRPGRTGAALGAERHAEGMSAVSQPVGFHVVRLGNLGEPAVVGTARELRLGEARAEGGTVASIEVPLGTSGGDTVAIGYADVAADRLSKANVQAAGRSRRLKSACREIAADRVQRGAEGFVAGAARVVGEGHADAGVVVPEGALAVGVVGARVELIAATLSDALVARVGRGECGAHAAARASGAAGAGRSAAARSPDIARRSSWAHRRVR